MNTEPSTVEHQRVVAEAAASYTPPEPQSYTLLMPHRESIATLRRKGASYRTIANILHTVQAKVSLDTLSRFYREVIEQRPARKSRRRSFIRNLSEQIEAAPPPPDRTGVRPSTPPAKKDLKASDTTMPARSKGPRIADPSSI
ncbi:hypothetical protein FEM03_07395 [Phragmitibacter flavus]|uniref:Uncharacterized protein n=1 Tax=Phragmitibacter flavus TaxID=2576071 RepID=A0A5R8KGA7_9BACT|nr:hypothetical protein [Phragmitibacter flavus]TLD71347.1 hypothetical protein FEM03_07395 [Phragmitibacter flavus]